MTGLATAPEATLHAAPAAPMRIVPHRRWGSSLAATLLVLFLAGFLALIATGGGVRWAVIPGYIFDPTILAGVRLTLVFTVLAMLIGTAGGVVLAVMRLSDNAVLVNLSRLYIWFFRATPLLVQIIFWFNIQLFIPRIVLGPIDLSMNALISAFTAALLALSLNESAYMAEIVRGGLNAVDRGQAEAATALGFTPLQTLRHVVLPQALRVVIPPIGNQTISMLKTTSLVSVVAAQDLLTRAQNIYARNFLIIELLIVASLWYLVLTTLASIGQHFIERRLGRSHGEPPPAGLGRFLRRSVPVPEDGR
ncbi:amino acid ABC transporter permease [Labrys wisconsinensis]|uniref:Polar amino acid transport system permease protein n=1 Tax=Labrys wisconsinensis TaxID=425677 RepID=A0ABU0JN09_9HYPH|nr:amino acid ABC transporter permease [Labrys wisconsinensis]MDQ0474542.1 polar amino acid transport system permease protein [Labrys wisconsinensis]